MRLLEAEGKPLTPSELERTARIGPETSVKVLADLVKAGLARHDAPSNSFSYGPFTREDRAAVEALATMYHQRPVTLVKLVYTQPPSAVQSFSDAFRLRGKPGED